MYSLDNRGVLPIPGYFGPPQYPYWAIELDDFGAYSFTRGTLWPYLPGGPDVRQRLFLCPSDGPERLVLDNTATKIDPTRRRNFTYNFNGQLEGDVILSEQGSMRGFRGIRLTQIAHPDHKLLVLEPRDPRNGGETYPVTIDANGNLVIMLSTRHHGRANQCFADGHIELFDPSVLGPPTNAWKHYGILTPDHIGYQP